MAALTRLTSGSSAAAAGAAVARANSRANPAMRRVVMDETSGKGARKAARPVACDATPRFSIVFACASPAKSQSGCLKNPLRAEHSWDQPQQSVAQPFEPALQSLASRRKGDAQQALAPRAERRTMQDDDAGLVQQEAPHLVGGTSQAAHVHHHEQTALRQQRLDPGQATQPLDDKVAA